MTRKQWSFIECILEEALALPYSRCQTTLAKWFINDEDTHLVARRLFHLAASGTGTSDLPPEISGWRPVLSLGSSLNSNDYLVQRFDDDTLPMAVLHLGKSAFSDENSIELFQKEITRLDEFYDPSFCHIRDSGLDDSNRPYIVSDFVTGIPIHEAAKDFDTRTIVRIFRKLLRSMEYAHVRRVFHGSINPSHILIGKQQHVFVPGYAVDRILALAAIGRDFMLDPNLNPADILYFAPDQLIGPVLQPSTDIYSLGVAFYHILAGAPPYGNSDESLVELAALIAEKVSPPITGLDPALNHILQTALAKNPDSRYPSLAAFSKDIDRYLDGSNAKKVRLPGAHSSLWNFAADLGRQHWLVIALSLAVCAIYFFAFRHSTNPSIKAGEILKKADALVVQAKFTKMDAAGKNPVQLAKSYLDTMLADSRNSPEVQRELALSYLRLAEAELKGFGSTVIDHGLALQSSRSAYELNALIVDRALAKAPLTDELALEYARSARTFVKLLKDAKNYDEAFRVAKEWQNRFTNISSSNIDVIRASALANTTMADLLYEAGLMKDSLDVARQAMKQYDGIYQKDQSSQQNILDYASALRSVGTKHLALNQAPEAIQAFQVAEKVVRVETEKPKPDTAPLIDLAQTLVGLGEAFESSKQSQKALGSYLESRRIMEEAAKRESGNDEVLSTYAESLVHTARFQLNARNAEAAIQDSERSIEVLRLCLAKINGNTALRRNLARALSVKASALLLSKRNVEARQAMADALTQWDHYSRTNGIGPNDREEMRSLRLMGRTRSNPESSPTALVHSATPPPIA